MTSDGTSAVPPSVEPVRLEVEVYAPLARLEACCGLEGRALGARIDLSGLLASAVRHDVSGGASEALAGPEADYLLPRRSA
jgi:hypothetical protein